VVVGDGRQNPVAGRSAQSTTLISMIPVTGIFLAFRCRFVAGIAGAGLG
jgi:hypothetical protein